jgi:hypothetical protein
MALWELGCFFDESFEPSGTRARFSGYSVGAPERNSAMCEYSLEHVASRAAVISDRLVTTAFPTTTTRGFATVEDPNTAVCLSPGTEIAFESPPRYGPMLWPKNAAGTVARFRQINRDRAFAHHDALEFSDGMIVPLARLRPGQHATVLQLPSARRVERMVAYEVKTVPEASCR